MNEAQNIERYLLKQMDPAEALLFEARVLLYADLRDSLHWQKKTFDLVKAGAQKKIRAEIEAVHDQLFKAPQHLSFRRRIAAIFGG